MKLSSPFKHSVAPVRKASIVISSLVGGWVLLFASATVYGYQTQELQKITTQPIVNSFKQWNEKNKQKAQERQEDRTQREEALRYIKQKQREIEQGRSQTPTTPQQKSGSAKSFNTGYSYNKQPVRYQPPTTKTQQIQPAQLPNWGPPSEAELEQSRQETQNWFEETSAKQEASMRAREDQAKADLDAFKAESEARIEAFKQENGFND